MSEPWIVDMMRAGAPRRPSGAILALPAPLALQPLKRDWLDLSTGPEIWPLQRPLRFRMTSNGLEPSLRYVLNVVAAETKVGVKDMVSARRFKQTVRARQIFYYAAREFTSRSLPEIGRAIGGKDHATVLHGIRKVDKNIAHFQPELDLVRKRLRNL